ncbi:MAG TPA: hypothetical protein VFH38_11295 [Jatrophihabitans sp.]|nr:hypothetical protein [Jatrophihabitans sp.]
MHSNEDAGVLVPVGDSGRRSSSALGRALVADALRGVDGPGAAAAERVTNWRSGYLGPFRRLVEAGLGSRAAALSIAADGLSAAHRRMTIRGADGAEVPLAAFDPGEQQPRRLATTEVAGDAAPETELTVPLRGSRLGGAELSRRLDAWCAAGVLEPSAAERIREVAAHPEWLRLEGRTVVVLGAGAEMGPLPALLRWGARVAAVDLPIADIWQRIRKVPSAGRLLLPTDAAGRSPEAGLDLLTEPDAAVGWIASLDGAPVLGNYVYADGVTNLRLSCAVDLVTDLLQRIRPEVALAFLATPTDVFAVPPEAVEFALTAYANRSRTARLLGRPLRAVSAGRLLRRPYVAGVEPGINDALVPQQGPNYALAKRLQRWRATVARDRGTLVSMNVAPPTRTRSVVRNRALAAAYAGAHRFGVEVFEPATANTLMAALLVADLHTGGGPAHPHPWQDEAFAAVHGGLWRTPYEPRSALGLAAVLGYGAARA